MISDRSARDVARGIEGQGRRRPDIHQQQGRHRCGPSRKRQASRINGAKSRGPTSPEGKAITRFNGLTHTLCATQAVLPGEDPAQFQAHRDALFDDWQPMSYTRALLVERVAIASWRLRRAVTSESALRGRAADDAVRAYDAERQAAVDRAVDRFEDDPRAALSLLEYSALGIDRLVAAWGELDAALEDGPSGWSQRFHLRLMLLLGHPDGTDLITAGAAAHRLAAAAGGRASPASSRCRRARPRSRSPASGGWRPRPSTGSGNPRRHAPDHSGDRRRAAEAASGDMTAEAQLRHRYEMALDRSLRGTIYQLIALDRSGTDLPEPAQRPGRPRSRGERPRRPNPREDRQRRPKSRRRRPIRRRMPRRPPTPRHRRRVRSAPASPGWSRPPSPPRSAVLGPRSGPPRRPVGAD